MTPKTLRRKLQKKAKHRPYGKCPRCGERLYRGVVEAYYKQPDGLIGIRRVLREEHRHWTPGDHCPYQHEIPWLGGGKIGRRIPQERS